MRLEAGAGKQRVLALFAAYAPFGGNIVGLDAASWRYFGRTPDNLSWAETALLAVLPNSPGLLRPGHNEDALLAKRNHLLDDLHADGTIDDTDWHLALEEPLPGAPVSIPQDAPQLVASLLSGALSGVTANRTGRAAGDAPALVGSESNEWRIRTTIDANVQHVVESVLARNDRLLADQDIHNAAVLVVDVKSGATLAYAGNLPIDPGVHAAPDDENGRSVDVIQAERSTGSLLKPFLYAAMVDTGEILPTELIPDIPTRMGGYMPENFNGTYLGAVPASEALARSLNVPMARLLRAYGINRFYALLKAHGMTTLHRNAEDYGIALILGGAEGTPWELTGMYASMARSALEPAGSAAFYPPHVVAQGSAAGAVPTDGRGSESAASGGAPGVVSSISPAAWWVTLQALLEVKRPDEDAGWRDFLSSQPISWKTGTSYGNRDAWAIGVTPAYAVGVWVGNASGAGAPSLRGSAAAAPLLFQIFNLLGPQQPFPRPAGLVPVEVCTDSGFLAGPYCGDRTGIEVPAGARAAQSCPYCRLVHLDPSGRYQVNADCQPVDQIQSVWRFVLPPAMEWYYTRSGARYQSLPPYRADCRPSAAEASLGGFSVVFPEEHSSIYVPTDYDGAPGAAVFEVIHHDPSATVYWHLDGVYLGETRGIHQWEVHPQRGRHELVVVDSAGDRVVRDFEVISN
jgi:penicillin-binding protein 1C